MIVWSAALLSVTVKMNGVVPAGVVLAAVLLREPVADATGVGQLLGRPGHPLAGLLDVLAVDREEVGVVEVLAGVLAHVRPSPVQHLLEGLGVDRGGHRAGHASSLIPVTTPDSPAQARSVR